MTMNAMVKYLEDLGFKTTKKYISERRVYEFRIEKDGVTAVAEYMYTPGIPPYQMSRMQETFLDNLKDTWKKAYERSAVFATENPYRHVLHNLDVASMYPDVIDGKKAGTPLMDEFVTYVLNTERLYNIPNNKYTIKDVIFNAPATIVFWSDGSKTVVKCQNDEIFDPEKGLAMAIAKKALGNKGNYCNEFKKWVNKYEETKE